MTPPEEHTMSKMENAVLEAATAEIDTRNRTRRKRLFIVFGAVLLKAGIAYGAYEYLHAARFVATDNAYTAAETAQVTPAISGIVREVHVADTQPVKQGDVIVVLDDTDARLALDQAEAELGRSIRRVRGYVANDSSLAAQIASRVSEEQRVAAQLTAARADFERAEVDLERRKALASSGSVSGDELTKAENAYETAQANLVATRASAEQAKANYSAAIGSRAANAVLIADATEETNPEVTLARARRDQAAVNLERTVIRAPVDGVVVKRTVQVGQQVQAGSPLLSVVPLSEVHVDANFKEVQLDKVRIGQPVEVFSDLYGKKVTYHGTVTGLSGGTGSAFATIPAQNATGNWIKVVQRVPVRVRLDAAELKIRPLQVGLSMHATIDTRATN
jgi:membrane fusion protein (multidrug efflux system)